MGSTLSTIKDKTYVPLNVLAAFLAAFDVYSDLALAAEYYGEGHNGWAKTTFSLVGIPWLINCGIALWWWRFVEDWLLSSLSSLPSSISFRPHCSSSPPITSCVARLSTTTT